MTGKMMTCASVDELLLDILEGDVSAETSAAVEEHVSECARCAALLRDIRDVRESAAALPDLAPSADLWKGISSRIEAPVVALGGRKQTRFAAPAWIAAAAALLIAASSGITYWATARSIKPAAPLRSVASAPAAVVGKTETSSVDVAPSEASEPVNNVRAAAPSGRHSSESTSARLVSNRAVRSAFAADTVLASEISRLQHVIAERRGDLDPQTVTIVETNLKLIDAAIRSSRAALAKDPASRFLNQQVTRALDKKVELLRTVALMPSST